MPIPLSVGGGTLAAGQTGNVVFLSVGLIGQQISDVEVQVSNHAGLYAGNLFDDGFRVA